MDLRVNDHHGGSLSLEVFVKPLSHGGTSRHHPVGSKNAGGFARVVLQESPTPFATRHRALALCLVADRRQAQDMALALTMPLVVTMRHLLRQRMGERRFPTADPPRETCLCDRPYPAFRRGVVMRRPRQCPTRHHGGGDALLPDGAVLPLPA